MAVRGLLSLLAGMGSGAIEGTRYNDQQARQAKMDQIALDRSAREGTEFDQAQQDRTTLRAAAAPVQATPDTVVDATGQPVQQLVKPDTMDNADVGQPGEAPLAPAMRVGNQTGLTAPQATAAAAAANTPDAVRARQLAVLNVQSPERAAMLQAHDLSAKNSQMDLAQKEFDNGLNVAAAKGLDALVDYTNKSGTSPFQAKMVASADGKTGEIHQVLPDGSLKPTGLTFTNDAAGAMQAATMLAQSVPITQKLKFYSDQRKDDIAARREDRQADYQSGMLGVAQQNADTNERYRQDSVDQKRDAVDAKASGRTAADKMPEADKLTYANALKRQAKLEDLIDKAKADGTWDPKNPQQAALDTERLAQGVTVRRLESQYSASSRAAGAPDPLGLRSPPSNPGDTPTRISPATQAARDADRAPILADEYLRAKSDDDRAGIAAEIKRLPASVRADAQRRIDSGVVRTPDAAPARPAMGVTPVPAAAPVVAAAPVAAPAAVAPVAPVAQMGGARVPAPPPQFGFNGNARAENPNYAAWVAKYGTAYAQQQAADEMDAERSRAAAQAAVNAARGPNVATRSNF